MAKSAATSPRITTGTVDWSGGVDSGINTLISSQINPNGLPPNKVPWLINATVRDGGISPRPGLQYLCALPIVDAFQEATLYEPDFAFPYIVAQVGGRTFRVRVDTDNSVEELTIAGDANPASISQNWMCQGEQFLVIQDGISQPLVWDGSRLFRLTGSMVLGTTLNLFNAPAVGEQVDVTLTGAYAGSLNQRLLINGKEYIEVEPANFVRLKNLGNPNTTSLITAGSAIADNTGDVLATLVAPIPIPAIGAQVDVFIAPIDVPLAGTVNIGGYAWQVMTVGGTPAAANHVFLVNLTDTVTTPQPAGSTLSALPQLPPGEAMDYYMGRIWVANGRQYVAGDIVGSPGAPSSGSATYDFRDSILYMTENVFINGGGAFIVPTNAGNIRAMKHSANLNTALGEGLMFPFTRKTVYSVNVPVSRADWAALKEPLQRVAQINYGAVSDRAVIPVNGDLYYQSVDGVRSFSQAVRNYEQPGQLPISQEEQRAIVLNDKSLLRFATGCEFDNRLLQSCLPYMTPVGVAHRALMPLNFDLQGNIQSKLPPAWEGAWEGLAFLRVMSGDFGGRQRAFAIAWSERNQRIEVWEITNYLRNDAGAEGDNRITWIIETPSYDWGKPFGLKELDTLELWIDRLVSKVEMQFEYRSGEYPCWTPWNFRFECAAANECENLYPPVPCEYPEQTYRPQYRIPITLNKAPAACDKTNGRPTNLGFTFQFRIKIKGSCRIRGLIAHAIERERGPYDGMNCGTNSELQAFVPAGTNLQPASGFQTITGPRIPGPPGLNGGGVESGTVVPTGAPANGIGLYYQYNADGNIETLWAWNATKGVWAPLMQ